MPKLSYFSYMPAPDIYESFSRELKHYETNVNALSDEFEALLSNSTNRNNTVKLAKPTEALSIDWTIEGSSGSHLQQTDKVTIELLQWEFLDIHEVTIGSNQHPVLAVYKGDELIRLDLDLDNFRNCFKAIDARNMFLKQTVGTTICPFSVAALELWTYDTYTDALLSATVSYVTIKLELSQNGKPSLIFLRRVAHSNILI